MNKLGCIGMGNMGGAIVEGVVQAGLYNKEDIIASCVSEKTLTKWKSLGYQVVQNNSEVAKNCDILFLCVKPYQMEQVVSEIQSYVSKDTIVCSVVTGFSLEQMHKAFPNRNVCRAMPNTAVKVQQGYTALMANEKEKMQSTLEAIFGALGGFVWLEESKLDGFIGLCGSGIAFGYIYLEATMEAGIRAGFKADVALDIACQATRGACEMVMKTKEHPAKLKNDVCSPSGTTIEGCLALEREGFRKSIQEAVQATIERARNM